MSATLSLFDRPLAARAEPPPRLVRAPWPFQEVGIGRIGECLAEHQSTLLVQPTGTGKTFTAATYVRRSMEASTCSHVLWLAHRQELIEQARESLQDVTGQAVSIEKADQYARGTRVVVASVQTLKGDRLSTFRDRFSPDLIVTDEAHHAPSASYRAIYEAFPGARHLGLTATPDRHDEKAMGLVFDSVAFVYEIRDAIRDGYLCPIRALQVQVDAIDLRAVGTIAGDLNQAEANAVMSAEEALHGVVGATIEHAGDRRTIVFTTSVENAHRLAEIHNRYRPDAARAVDGGTDPRTRATTLRDHKGGAYQTLYNVGVLTEGYDDPAIACVVMARPTLSRALYAQCAGRGLRIAPGKVDCLLIDLVGNSGKHSLVTATDILAGKYDDETLALAKEKVADADGGILAEEALEAAAREMEARRLAEAARRARIQGAVRTRAHVVDPFGVLRMKDPSADEWSERYATPASDAQLGCLTKFKIPLPENCTKAQASKLIGAAIKRRELGLATFGHVKALGKYGVDALNMSFERASSIMTAIQQNGWRPLAPAHLSELMERHAGEE